MARGSSFCFAWSLEDEHLGRCRREKFPWSRCPCLLWTWERGPGLTRGGLRALSVEGHNYHPWQEAVTNDVLPNSERVKDDCLLWVCPRLSSSFSSLAESLARPSSAWLRFLAAPLPKSDKLRAWLPLHIQFTSWGKKWEKSKCPPVRDSFPHPGALIQRVDV